MSRRGPCRPPTGACRPRGTPWTNRSTSRRRCLRGGKAPRCSPRRAVLPVQCGSFLQPSTAGVSDAECSSELVLPELFPARISVSSSLLAATMNQKSSLREDPNFVSWALTANSRALMSDEGSSAKALPKGLGDRAFAHGAHGNSYRCLLGSQDHFRDAWVSRLGTDLLKRLTVRP